MNERLYRSVDDRIIAGVAGGLADRLGMDPSIVRIIWALLVIGTKGAFLLVYIVMAIVIPEEEAPVPVAPVEGEQPSDGAAGQAPPASSPAAWGAQARAARRSARAARRTAAGPGQAPIIIGVLLIMVGVWFLIDEYIPGLDMDRVWPFMVLGLGVLLLVYAVAGRSGSDGPGTTAR